jgi:hypothetical protein
MPELNSVSPLKSALIPIGKSGPEVQVNPERWDQTKTKNGKPVAAMKGPSTRMVLEEVFELLEDYAPIWYTQDQHDRIMAALSNRDE